MSAFNCPKCAAPIRTNQPVPAGKPVRCPRCQQVFKAPGDGETAAAVLAAEADEFPEAEPRGPARGRGASARRPREEDGHPANGSPRPRQQSGSNVLLWVLLAGGAAAVLVVAAVVVIVAVLLLSPDPTTSAKAGGAGPAPGGDNPAATKENLRKFQAGATREEFEKVFGQGEAVGQADVERAGTEIGEAIRQNIQWQAAQHRIGTWYVWRNGPGAVYAGFAPTKAGDRLAFSFYASRQGNSVDYQAGALALGPLDQEVEKQAKEQNVFNDPRWKSGAEARNLLVGSWRDPNFGLNYNFKADGTVECSGVYTSTYRFTDDRHIEIPIPHPIDPNQKTPTVYRVLVDQTTLYLGEVDGPNIHLRGPMQRTGADKGGMK